MISAFSILFLFALLSLVLHRSVFLKPFALLGLSLAFYYNTLDMNVGLLGFAMSDSNDLFQLILDIVLFAVILHENEDITITQTLFLGSASTLLLQSQTVLSFILAFESLSLISLILITQIKTKEHARAAVKMFLAGAIATGILFLGLSFYLMGGGLLLEPFNENPTYFQSFGIFFMLAGIFYKLTIVPFHSWAVDTYAHVKHTHGAILSGVAKTVAFIVVFHIFSPALLSQFSISVPYLIILALVTMTLGNVLALFRQDIAKILAYSSIAHAGYMLLAFVALQSEYAKDGVLYMAIAYIFMQSGAFLALDILKKHYKISTLEELKGFVAQNALLSFFFSLQLFSLAGIPLLAGFLAKAVMFYAVVDAGYWWVALIALLNSALSVGYYAWIVKNIYFDTQVKSTRIATIPTPMLAQVILVSGTIYFGIFAGTIFK